MHGKEKNKISWDQNWFCREQVQEDMYMLQSQQMQHFVSQNVSWLMFTYSKRQNSQGRNFWLPWLLIREGNHQIFFFLSIYCPLDVFILILFLLYKTVAAFCSFFFFSFLATVSNNHHSCIYIYIYIYVEQLNCFKHLLLPWFISFEQSKISACFNQI